VGEGRENPIFYGPWEWDFLRVNEVADELSSGGTDEGEEECVDIWTEGSSTLG
jgi:hypothetical protein